MIQPAKGAQIEKVDVDALIKEGTRLLAAQEYEKAKDLFSRAIEQEPNKLSHQYHLGRALLFRGRIDAAEQCFQKMLVSNQKSHLGLYGMAQVATARKQWDAAIKDYRNLITMQPKWLASVYKDLGALLSKLDRWQEAIECHQQLVQIDTNNYLYHQALGDTLFKAYRYLDAVEAYQRVLQLNPDIFWPLYQLGKAFFKIDEFEKSAIFFEKAYLKNKDRFDCYELSALSCEFAGLKEKSVKYWKSLLEYRADSCLASIFKREKEKLAQASDKENEKIMAFSHEKEKLIKENELLLLQLHQVQDQLETYYLKSQKQEQILKKYELVIERNSELEKAREELAQQIRESKLQPSELA